MKIDAGRRVTSLRTVPVCPSAATKPAGHTVTRGTGPETKKKGQERCMLLPFFEGHGELTVIRRLSAAVSSLPVSGFGSSTDLPYRKLRPCRGRQYWEA